MAREGCNSPSLQLGLVVSTLERPGRGRERCDRRSSLAGTGSRHSFSEVLVGAFGRAAGPRTAGDLGIGGAFLFLRATWHRHCSSPSLGLGADGSLLYELYGFVYCRRSAPPSTQGAASHLWWHYGPVRRRGSCEVWVLRAVLPGGVRVLPETSTSGGNQRARARPIPVTTHFGRGNNLLAMGRSSRCRRNPGPRPARRGRGSVPTGCAAKPPPKRWLVVGPGRRVPARAMGHHRSYSSTVFPLYLPIRAGACPRCHRRAARISFFFFSR